MKLPNIYIILFLLILPLFGQSKENHSINKFTPVEQTPKESLYLHINSTNLFVGEHLFYKVYNLMFETNKLSDYSKIAYVSLVGKNNEIVFTHKIKLIKGQGHSDFFIPVSIPSGQYKLVAYTSLSLNQKLNNYFVTDLGIINPYIAMHENLTTIAPNDTKSTNNTQENSENKVQFLQIDLPKTHFSLRENVIIKIKNHNQIFNGSYSVSVRKMDDIINIDKADIHNYFLRNYLSSNLNDNNKMKPEHHGELITGKIIPNIDTLSVDYKGIVLSIPDENTILKISNTNREGFFDFYLEDEYRLNQIFVQMLGDERENYSLQIDRLKAIDYSFLKFEKLTINPSKEDDIIERSIKIQIEDSYNFLRSDLFTFKEIKSKDPYSAVFTSYKLDDYTRFPTLNETMTEIVKFAWFEKFNFKENKYRLKVRGFVELFEYESPLVVMDGLLIQNHNDLYDFNAYKIKEIKLFRDKYYYQGHYFQGIVVIETFEKDFYKQMEDPHILIVNHFRPEHLKEYHTTQYQLNNIDFERIPDYRSQLLWNPEFKIESNEVLLNFFTSDNEGIYEIIIEGFTNDGKSVSAVKQFSVKDNSKTD